MAQRIPRIAANFILALTAMLLVACSSLPTLTEWPGQISADSSPVLAKPVPQADRPGTSRAVRRGPAQDQLEVTATQPSDGAVDVDPSTQIIVIFNRPVVPLTGAENQGALPQPLSFTPEAPGQGRWISTSVYSFQPSPALLGATTYSVAVAELESSTGERLEEPAAFAFSTAAPTVVGASPIGDNVAPDAGVTVEFSQPMEPATTEAAFSVSRIDDEAGTPIDGEITWDKAGTTLHFTPTAALEFDQTYAIGVAEEATPSGSEGRLREPFVSMFNVVPYPDIVSITPADKSVDVAPDTSVIIRFNTHVSPTQALGEVHVSPILTTTSVYSYYSVYDDELMLSWYKEPNTEYTITVGGDIQDDYGNTLGEDRVFTFVTGDHSPFVDLELERFTHLTASEEGRVGVLYRNVDSVDVDLYRLPLGELLRLAGGDQWQVWQDFGVPNADDNRVWHRTYDTSGDPNVTIRQIITLTNETDGPLAPGAYFLDVTSPDTQPVESGSQREQAALIVSDANLVIKKSRGGPSLAWLTDLATGEPIGEVDVTFYLEGETVGTQVTDRTGVAMQHLLIRRDEGWRPVVAVSGSMGQPDFAVASSEWNTGIAPWDFDLMSGWGGEPVQAHFYTDRPIYRPGDTVYWKGIVRLLVDDEYLLPPEALPVAITVRNDMGAIILQEDVKPNEMGTVNGEFALDSEAGTGYYFLEARIGDDDASAVYNGVGFQVAEYRKPEFEVSVQSEQAEYVQGETVRIAVDASYFSGDPLSGAPVTWRLIADPYFFSWSDDEGRSYSFSPYDAESDTYDPYRGVFTLGLITEGAGVTDAQGSFVIEMPADISQSLQSQNWAFDVTVQSGTNQFVTGQTSVPVHRAAFYIGQAPRAYVVSVGEEAEVDLVALTPQYEPVPGAELDVVVYDFNWNSVYERGADGSFYWETSVERTPVHTTTVTANRDGAALVQWTPEQPGQYQIVASGQDDDGNPTSSAGFLYVSSTEPGEFVAWPMKNNDRIEIVADKQSYGPGDTARILVPSPFQGAVRALVTTERAGVMGAEVLTLEANSQVIEIPIREIHVPNVYVSVILAKGVDEANPLPALRVGYAKLAVDTTSVELSVDVDVSDDTVRPGDTVTYTLRVTDNLGNPQAGAELSAALVDKAVLSLAGSEQTSLLDAFYSERPLDVSTGASLVINQDRISQQLSEGAKGGGGGGGGTLEVRSDFRDVAYWQAELRTGADGRVQFPVTLPDGLTTWRLIARAVDGETQVGEASAEVIATKELQLRPLLPRFLTAGDRPWLGAQLVNTSDVSVTGVMTFTLEGAGFATGDSQTLPFTLAPGAQTSGTWPAEVSHTVDEVAVLAIAVAEAADASLALSDGVSLTLPVIHYETPEVVASSGVVPPGGVVEQIVVPEDATDEGSLDVRIEPSLAAGMLEGLEYLQHYPYECNEQLVSRFLPNLVTVRALRALGIDDRNLESQLSYQLGIGVQRLVTRQNPDGGWGYWPGEESSPFITAYVLWGISLAEDQGYAVPASTRDNAIAYLDSAFETPHPTVATWRLNEMAFVHYVLSELDAGDPGRASTLYDVRENLGTYGRALLAVALANMNESGSPDTRVETLLDDIVGDVALSATGAHWEEDGVDFQTLSTDTRSTSIVLAALARLRPDQPILPQTVRWLMVTRETGRWSNTQENTWAIIGLTDWLVVSRELEAGYDWSVELNGDEMGAGSVSPGQIPGPVDLTAPLEQLVRDVTNELAFARNGDDGQLYYTMRLRYYVDAAAIDAADRGIIVARRFAATGDAEGQSISSAAVGDVISVTITIVAPTDLHQLLVEAPIPAGTEPIDPRLSITGSQFGEPYLVDSNDGSSSHGWWRHWVPTHTDYRDDKVALFATWLPAGTYEYTFNVRASLPGEFRVLPVYAEMMYFNEVWGRSEGALFTVKQ